MSRYSDLVKLYAATLGRSEQDVQELIKKNLGILSGDAAKLEKLIPSSDIMSQLGELQADYRAAIQEELELGLSSVEKQRTLSQAMNAPTMNFNLISSFERKRGLQQRFTGIFGLEDSESVFQNLGLPSIPVQSGNPRKQTAYMLTPGSEHPVDILLSGRAVNIRKGSMPFDSDSISVGYQNIPTVEYMQRLIEQRKSPFGAIDQALQSGPIKFVSLDIETSGVGPYDVARSVAAEVRTVQPGTSVANALAGMSTSADERIGFHMLTPEMDNLVVGRPGGRASERLGRHVAEKEIKSGVDKIFDLSTPAGRQQAAEQYSRLFTTLAQDDVYIVGSNVADFDIIKLASSASAIPEFAGSKENMELLQKVLDKPVNGKVIDVTQMLRTYLSKQLQETAQSLSGLPPDQMAQKLMSTLLAPETIGKAGALGEAVRPAGMENVLLATDMLERLSGMQGGDQIIDALASGNHIADTDQFLSLAILREMSSSQLKFLPQSQRSTDPKIIAARAAISKAGAVVPTTNISDLDTISDHVMNFMIGQNGGATLRGARIQAPTVMGVKGFIYFDPESGQYQKMITSGPNVGTTISQPMQSAENQIRAALQSGQGVITTGINYSEASQMERTFQLGRIASSISPVVTPGAVDLTSPLQQQAFLDAMVATRKYIGFEYLSDRPTSITRGGKSLVNMMRGRFDGVSEAAVGQAASAIYRGGAGLAFMDPVMRSNFVAMATLTSDLPFTTIDSVSESGETVQRVSRQIVSQITSATDLSEEQVLSVAKRAGEVSKQFSEMGIMFTRSQQQTRILRATGETGKVMLSSKMMNAIMQREGADFFKTIGLGKAYFSVVDDTKELVNVVLGSGRMSRDNASKLAESIVGVIETNIDSSADDLVKAGLVGSVEEAGLLKGILRPAAGATGAQMDRVGLVSNLIQELMAGGPVAGYLDGDTARGAKAILARLGASSGNDLIAVQRGFIAEVSEAGDDFLALTMSTSENVLSHMESINPTMAQAARAEIAGGQYSTFKTALQMAEENPEFREKALGNFAANRVDTGLFGSTIGRNRIIRDEKIVDFMRRAKPKVGVAALGVAAFSAGYYLAKRNRKIGLYDEVMHQQPYEQTDQVQQTNYETQAKTQIYSERRDPLVTAGVVGNLDRNKIGHSMMGPNKYDYLYGR